MRTIQGHHQIVLFVIDGNMIGVRIRDGFLIGNQVRALHTPKGCDFPLMIRSGLQDEDEAETIDPSRGATLIMLSVATSIDAFAVGLSLAVLGVSIILPSMIIGLVAGGMSLLGIFLGGRLGKTFGKRMEVVGGVILIAIGARVVISHLL